jgi:outer membrane protein
MADQVNGMQARARAAGALLAICAGVGIAQAQPPVVVTGEDDAAPNATPVVVEYVAPVQLAAAANVPDVTTAVTGLQPLGIDGQWSPLKIDLNDVVLPTDNSDLIRYLAEGYFPQEAELSIDEALSIALEHNHALNAKRLSAAAACQGIDINWTALNPQLSLQSKVYFTRGDAKATSVTIAGKDGEPDKTFSLGGIEKSVIGTLALSLTQRIYDWGLTNRQIDISRAQYSVQNFTVDMAEQQLVSAVITGYYQFSEALGQVRIRRDELSLAGEFLRQAQIQYEVGTAPRLDVIRAEARMEQARDSLVSALSTLGNAAAAFYALLGSEDQRYVPAIITASLIDAGVDPPGVDAVTATAVATRPEVELQYAALTASQVKVSLTRNRPILQGYANAQLQDPAVTGGSQNYEYGLQLQWSLYNGGKDKLERKQAQTELASLSEGVLDLEAQIELDATTSWNRLFSARASVQAAKKSTELSAEALRAASVGYAAGVTPYIDFQNALDTNVAAALSYLMALVEVKLAQVNLDRAQGFPGGYPGDTRAGRNGGRTVQEIVPGASQEPAVADAAPAPDGEPATALAVQ